MADEQPAPANAAQEEDAFTKDLEVTAQPEQSEPVELQLSEQKRDE